MASAAEGSIAVCPKFDFKQYRYAPHRRRFCVGLGHTAVDFKTETILSCLASSRGRQNGGLGHTGIGDLAVCHKFINLLPRYELYRRRS